MTSKETAAQRRAREAAAARAAEERWEREKPARLLRAMATATDLNVEARVYHRYDSVLYYSFRLGSHGEDVFSDPVAELGEWTMQNIEQRLGELREAELKRIHMEAVRREVISLLTDEQREALGL
jgi:hypothetical protein